MKRIALAFLLLLPAAALAQFTTVTGTVIDPNGIPYAFGTIVPTLVTSASPTLNGLAYTPPTQPIGLASDGSFIMRLADNTVLLPAATKWNFLVCSAIGTIQPAGGKGPICFSLAAPITISGASQSISTQLQAAALALTQNPGTGTVTHSVALTLNQPVVGNGGADLKVGTKTGNTNQFATWTGPTTAASCVDTDASGNLQVTSTDCVVSGVDINTSSQVVSTHLSAALPVNQGGTGTASTLTGLVRGSAGAMTAAELSGDATTSGSNAVTVVQVNGGAIPISAKTVGTNGSGQLVAYVPKASAFGSSGTSALLSTATGFDGIWQNTTEANVNMPVPFAGTLKNLQIHIAAAPGNAGLDYTFTLRQNAASTAVVCTISGANTLVCSDLTHSVTVAAGDLICIQSVPTASPNPEFMNWSLEYDPQ